MKAEPKKKRRKRRAPWRNRPVTPFVVLRLEIDVEVTITMAQLAHVRELVQGQAGVRGVAFIDAPLFVPSGPPSRHTLARALADEKPF